MDIEVRIRGLMMDPATSMPIVILKDVASETVMPIWVGIFEANAIAIEIEKVAAPHSSLERATRTCCDYGT
jgi:bifunctional DNase/RNase